MAYRMGLSGSALSGSSSSALESLAGPLTNSPALSHHMHKKKPVLYQSYNPKQAIGLAG